MAKALGQHTLRRRLNLVDLVILVLAAAVGLVAVRRDLAALAAWPIDHQGWREHYLWTNPLVLGKAVIVEVWLMAWTAGWLALQLRRPRPRLRQLSSQPGFVACFSASAVLLVSGPLTWAFILPNTGFTAGWIERMVWGSSVSSQIGAAVLAGWALLLVSGRCRLRAGWLDRIGQVLGVIWVAMVPANLFHLFRHLLVDAGWMS
jgi:hypothetical protein